MTTSRIKPEDLKAAYAAGDQAQDWGDQDFLSAFDDKLTELGYTNTGAACQCFDSEHGHDPQCGWERSAEAGQ
jgi:hypothetical protein